MKVLVTGVGGQLGYDVMNELYHRGYEGIGTDIVEHKDLHMFDRTAPIAGMQYIQLDITDQDSVDRVINTIRPDAVVHCAAWTAVDAAEEEENRAKVYAINVDGTKYIAQACKRCNSKMIYISTDYVFNGQGEEPWEPECMDYAPLCVYGKSKLEGELAVTEILEKYYIVRIAWVFGVNGNNFVKTMLNLGKKHDTLRVVCDQIGTPTYTYDLARLLVDMLETERYGYYHATNEGGYISWYEFACKIFELAGYSTKVIPVTTEEYGVSKAVRPKNSRLGKERLIHNGFRQLASWEDAVLDYLRQLQE